jgi:hypothetical protein
VSREVIQWVTASPLWSTLAADAPQMQRPALLGFAGDSFMDDLSAVLASDPRSLAAHLARPESHRARPPGEALGRLPTVSRLKLFQAAHGRFYLVAAELVCRRPGLPDHAVATGQGEQVSFVIRRLASGVEHAWVTDATAGGGRSWRALGAAVTATAVPGEDLLPLFPVSCTLSGRSRRLFVGLVPTSSVETFRAAGGLSPLAAEQPVAGAPTPDGRLDQLDTRVVAALEELAAAEPGPGPEEASLFVLLDLGDFLQEHVPRLWASILASRRPAGGDERALYDALDTLADRPRGLAWRTALQLAWGERLVIAGEQAGAPTIEVDLRRSLLSPRSMRSLVADVLPPVDAATSTGVDGVDPSAVEVPKLDPQGEAAYTLRCVYRRPQCGPLHPDVVSNPSERFSIAPFFDTDAPAREIRIHLPVDTSIKDLRKFRKNVGFLISKELREQMNRIGKLEDVMKGDLAAGRSVDLGMLCSFSMPIITICALIVLMIFVSLLNIVFWWKPFLRICFPLRLGGS